MKKQNFSMLYLMCRLYQTKDFSCQKYLLLLFSTEMKNLFIAIFLVLSRPIFASEAPWIDEDGSCEVIDVRNMGHEIEIILCITIPEREYIAFIVRVTDIPSPISWIQADWKTTHHFFPWVLEKDYKHPTKD